MNFSEFTRWLKSDPASQDADYQAARRSAPEFIAAAHAADAFESKLRQASRIPAPAGLTDNLKSLATPESSRSFPFRWRYAIAASLLLGVSALLLKQQLAPGFDSVEDYVAFHYSHDGQKLLGLANSPDNAPSAADLDRMLASVDLQMSAPLAGQVRLVKYCPTPEGRGIHLVMDTDQGLVTVIIMPHQQVQDGELFAMADMEAALISLPGRNAAAAIIGRPEQLGPALSLALQDAVHSGSADT